MKVSVITPTFGRDHHLESLYSVFAHQTYGDTELLIYDDSPSPSEFVQRLADPRVRYIYSPTRVLIGAKRDRLVREARGDVIVQFDDDDYYAPRYIDVMVGSLRNCDLVKLSKWFLLSSRSGESFYWDTTAISAVHFDLTCGEQVRPFAMNPSSTETADWLDKTLWGYGFSYVFRRDIYAQAQFDTDIDRKQDYAFIAACRRAGLRLNTIPDDQGLALHVIHDTNTSRAFPNYWLPSFVLPTIFGAEVEPFLDRSCPRRQAP